MDNATTADGQGSADTTTESSQRVLKAVAGRLANIEAGEMPTLRYVGSDERAGAEISHTGEIVMTPEAPLMADSVPEPQSPAQKSPGWQPSTPKAQPRLGFFARLLAKFRRSG